MQILYLKAEFHHLLCPLLHFTSLKNVEKRFLRELMRPLKPYQKNSGPHLFDKSLTLCGVNQSRLLFVSTHVISAVLLLLLFISVTSSVVLLPPAGLFLSPHLSRLCSDVWKFAESQNLRIYHTLTIPQVTLLEYAQ